MVRRITTPCLLKRPPQNEVPLVNERHHMEDRAEASRLFLIGSAASHAMSPGCRVSRPGHDSPFWDWTNGPDP